MKNNNISPSDQEALNRAEELANKIKILFAYLDNLFIEEDHCEEFLALTKKRLEERISINESALAVIIAMGGDYDSSVDRAKVREITALTDLINARKSLKKVSEEEDKRKKHKSEELKRLGIYF